MKKLYIPLLSFCVVAIVSCSKDKEVIPEPVPANRPLVDFTIIPDSEDPFTFSFENKSSNYKGVEWRFGDDSLSTDVDPTHLYATAGTFQVNLQGIAEDGSTSRKLLEIKIPIDSVASIKSTNVDATTLRLSVESKAKIASLLWTFEDNSTSTSLTPTRSYKENTLNSLKVKMTTEKGSVVENSKFATTSGVVNDISNVVNLQSVSFDNGGGKNAAEGSLKIIDNKIDTKWYMSGWSFPIVSNFQFASAEKIKFYGIGSANDSDDRDPKTWTLEGSNDGVTWEVLDSRTLEKTFYAQAGNKWKQMFYFAIANPKPFQYYKWNVTANFGSGGFQISEFKFFR